ncbi:MAG: hypothetical protein ACR652_05395 [Methylocystis sp.]|uniref:hypothetical protein n=1 Tax=Methylocystis sp. TaxID=1911079 RepID=UPI003DA54D08
MIKHFEESDMRVLLHWEDLIASVEKGPAAFASGKVLQPVRTMLTIEEDRRYLGIMPAVAD